MSQIEMAYKEPKNERDMINIIRHEGIQTSNFSERQWALIEKYSPCLVYDDKEKFYPLMVGASIIFKTQHPPSLKRFYKEHPFQEFKKKLEVIAVNLIYGRPPLIYNLIRRWFLPISTAYFSGLKVKRAAKIIEYAIFYISDIQHIYDLEHVWVYLDNNDKPLIVKGTQHGMVVYLYSSPHKIKKLGTHPILIVSPGKHAHYTNANQLNKKILTRANRNAGSNGLYPIQFLTKEEWNRLKKVYPGKALIRSVFRNTYAYTPSFKFHRYIIPKRYYSADDEYQKPTIKEIMHPKHYARLVPWERLRTYIVDAIEVFLANLV